ncbi:MAG: hypothetical protein ACFWTZ_04090 [Burkholderia sp.]|jgi:hypothetical protein
MPEITEEEFDRLYGPLGTFFVVGRHSIHKSVKNSMVPYRTPEEKEKANAAYDKFLKGRTTDQYFWEMLDEANKEAAVKEKKP